MNRALLAIVAEGFASRLSFGIISFALPLYAHRLGLSMAEIGLLTSLNLVTALAFKPLMGWVADSFGLRRSLSVSVIVRSFVALLLSFAFAPWQLFAIRATHGLSKALRDPSADALIAEHGSKKAIASAFAWHQTAKSLAGSFGKAVAGALLTWTASDFSAVFFVAFVLSAAPVFLVMRLVPSAPRSTRRGPGKDKIRKEQGIAEEGSPARAEEEAKSPGARPPILSFAGLAFLISGTAHMLQGIFPILATEYAGLSEAETGLIFLASGLVSLVAGPLFGWLSDNVSRKLVFTVRSLANTFSSLVYLASPTLSGIATGRIVDDVGKAAFRPAWGSLTTELSSFDRTKRARLMGLMSMGEDAGEIAGPIVAGFVWQSWGVAAALCLRVVLAAATEVYTLVLTNRMRERETGASRQMVSVHWKSDEAKP